MKFKLGDKVWWKREPYMSGFVTKIDQGLRGNIRFFIDITFPMKKSILVNENEIEFYKEYKESR